MANVKLRAVTAIPVVLALLGMFLLMALSFGVIVRGYLNAMESSIRESGEHSPKAKQTLTIYVYNVSLCKMMNLIVKSVKGQSVSPEEADISGPVKILILNEGGRVLDIDHIVVIALGSKVYEAGLNTRLAPGEYLVYNPRELSLPENYNVLMNTLDTIIIYSGEENFQSLTYGSPPLTLINIDGGGGCSEP